MSILPAASPAIIDIAVANPAPGANWSYTVLTGQRLHLLHGRAILTNSATVASRLPRLTLTSAAGIAYYMFPNYAASASESITYNISPTWLAAGYIPTLTDTLVIPPDMYLKAGDVLAVSTLAIQVGDQWSNIVLRCHEWLEP